MQLMARLLLSDSTVVGIGQVSGRDVNSPADITVCFPWGRPGILRSHNRRIDKEWQLNHGGNGSGILNAFFKSGLADTM